MNTRLPCLTLCWLAIAVTSAWGWQQTAPRALRPVAAGVEPRQVLITARLMLLKQPTLTARVGQRVRLFGHEMLGAGDYRHKITTDGVYVRFELTMEIAGQTAKVLQVRDQEFLWTDTDWEGDRQITRVDLRRARKAVRANPSISLDQSGLLLPHGGLCDLLVSLEDSFQFDPLAIRQLGERPVYTLRGRWTAEKLRSLVPDHSPESASGDLRFRLPEHIPHEVQICLGRDDLFPYRIEYFRLSRASDGSIQQRSLFLLHFYEVRPGAPVDLRDIVYEPAKGDFKDITDQRIHQLKARMARPVAILREQAPR